MTEHFLRHGNSLTLVSIVYDPVYLEEPFVRTSGWVQSSGVQPDQPNAGGVFVCRPGPRGRPAFRFHG